MSVKIFYISDLHLEYQDLDNKDSPFYLYENDEMKETYSKSYLVLAGDICQIFEKEKFRKFLNLITPKFKAIIYVSGNHEYHRWTLNDIQLENILCIYENVYFLQNNFIEFPEDNIRFYGVTLWTKIDSNDEYNDFVKKNASDFRAIKNYIPLDRSYYVTREGTGKLFEKQFTKLQQDLTIKSRLKTIVVTHHTPFLEIIEPWTSKKEFNMKMRSMYASDIKKEISELDFDYWIFGHSHSTYNYDLTLKNNKQVTLRSNPYGYHGSNKLCEADIYIEVPLDTNL
jgi:predicted phosphodiesterase